MVDNMTDWDDTDPFWDVFYAIENLIDYWVDDRIDHAYVSYGHWATMIDF